MEVRFTDPKSKEQVALINSFAIGLALKPFPCQAHGMPFGCWESPPERVRQPAGVGMA